MGGRWPRCFPFDGMEGCRSLVGFRSSLAARAARDEEEARGVSDASMPVTSPGGAQQRFAPLTTVEQIPLRQNIAHRQTITPALAARGGCRRSGLAQKCCLRLAFAFDSDMESGNGRVPEPGCRVTDQMSQAAARSHRSAAQGAANQYKYRAYWPAMQRRAAMASADRQMTGDATLRTNTPPATRPGAAPARRWTAASSLRRQGR